MSIELRRHFVYHQTMNVVDDSDVAVSRIAAAIGEPARARILYCLMDGRARTSTELAVVAGVTPSTASVHLGRLKQERLINVLIQGKHRYYSLTGTNVASVLEGLNVLAGGTRDKFVSSTPDRMRMARTCYDHMAGTVGVLLHDRVRSLGWLKKSSMRADSAYNLTASGKNAFGALGIDIDALRTLRRRFAYPCLDWSERRPHLGGALGAALLKTALKRRWVSQEPDSRALVITGAGRRELHSRFGLSV